jgi:hypothetical protein
VYRALLVLSEPDADFGRETGLILRRDPESSYLNRLEDKKPVCFPKTQDIFQDDPVENPDVAVYEWLVFLAGSEHKIW